MANKFLEGENQPEVGSGSRLVNMASDNVSSSPTGTHDTHILINPMIATAPGVHARAHSSGDSFYLLSRGLCISLLSTLGELSLGWLLDKSMEAVCVSW